MSLGRHWEPQMTNSHMSMIRKHLALLACSLPVLFAACGGSSGGAPAARVDPLDLASLSLTGATLTPSFRADVTVYTAEAASSTTSVTVTAAPASSRSLVLIEGETLGLGEVSKTLPLAAGDTPILVSVVTEAGDFRNYELTITRPTSVSLTGLEVMPGVLSASFDPETTTYDVDCGYFVRNWFVTPTAAAGVELFVDGEVAVSGETRKIDLLIGTTDVTVRTVSGGQTRDYVLHVTRAAKATVAQEAYVKASNTNLGDGFGDSIAVSGDTLVVGASSEDGGVGGVGADENDDSAINAGAAYVYVRQGTSWAQQVYLKPAVIGAGDFFGSRVAIDGDTIVVGAPEEDSNATGIGGDASDDSRFASGAAYVFVRNGGVWTQQAYLKASNTGINDRFGCAVAISGDTIAIGARGEGSSATGVGGNQSDNGMVDSGAVYVFQRTGTVWSQQAYLKSDETQAGMQFGAAVDIDGDRIVVGAPQRNIAVAGDGRAYVFRRDGATWSQEATLDSILFGDGDNFGASVAIDGTAIIVGAPLEDSFSPIGPAPSGVVNVGDDSVTDSGAAFAFRFENGAWSLRYFLKAEDPLTGTGNEVGAQFGYSVAIEGDIVAVGSPFEDSATIGIGGTDTATGASGSGAVYTFQWLTANSLGRTLYCKASNTGTADWFGWSVAVGLDSVLVGAVHERSNATGIGGDQTDDSATDAGAAYVIR